MTTSYVKNQPLGFKNYVENVAIVGVAGRCGSAIAEQLIKNQKHKVTAITRTDSFNKVPVGIHGVKKVDYSDTSSLVDALKGQEALIITMAREAPKETHLRLIDAAVEAGVKWIMPNEWGVDISQVEMGNDTMLRPHYLPVREYTETVGGNNTSWIALCCGFWYEFSLAGTEARYGFDFDKKTLTLFDDGNTKINTSTWPQLGRAVAGLLSLKILPDNEKDSSPYLSRYKNSAVYCSSFHVSQNDMFQSVLRVSGDKEKDWTVTHEDTVARVNRGREILKGGNPLGFGIILYTRNFYNDGSGSFNDKLDNNVLGLPQEDFDEATKVGVEMALAGDTNIIH
ncbi:hypothetical protein MMC13_001534 [Lambiella insularis]|nr:hypothetical protein [Lambiella insularis]